jgi:hypothetical protein
VGDVAVYLIHLTKFRSQLLNPVGPLNNNNRIMKKNKSKGVWTTIESVILRKITTRKHPKPTKVSFDQSQSIGTTKKSKKGKIPNTEKSLINALCGLVPQRSYIKGILSTGRPKNNEKASIPDK